MKFTITFMFLSSVFAQNTTFNSTDVTEQVTSSSILRPLTTGTVTSAAPLTTPTSVNLFECTGTRIRKDIRDLTQPERVAFLTAFKELHKRGVLDRIVNKHLSTSMDAHVNPQFFRRWT
jgi:hypothetical protein